ncbi:unnamed protein product [Amoebophrya sp. A25]|nr:unnamed protein product [Amoebophrya sp. A25]|eukprot:GSA25T00011426001.1
MLADAAHVVFGEEKFPCVDSCPGNPLGKYSLLHHGSHIQNDAFQSSASGSVASSSSVNKSRTHHHLPGVARMQETSERNNFLECVAGTLRQSTRVGRFTLMLHKEWDPAIQNIFQESSERS